MTHGGMGRGLFVTRISMVISPIEEAQSFRFHFR